MDTPDAGGAAPMQATMRTSPVPQAAARAVNSREERAINAEIDKWAKLAIKPSSADTQLLDETKAALHTSNLNNLRELRKELAENDWMFQKFK
jgi:hypothetical protein